MDRRNDPDIHHWFDSYSLAGRYVLWTLWELKATVAAGGVHFLHVGGGVGVGDKYGQASKPKGLVRVDQRLPDRRGHTETN